jgi:hypothetical protein
MVEKINSQQAEFESRIGSFREVIGEWQEKPPRNDLYIAAYAQALHQELDSGSPIGTFLHDLLEARSIGSTTLATKVLRATQRQILFGGWDTQEGEYPRSFHTPEQWQKAFDWLFAEDGSIREEQFFIDVWARPLQSNVFERYMAFKAFVVGARRLGRLSTKITMGDMGTSQMAGPNYLASGLAFPPPNFVMPGSSIHTPHIAHTAAFHDMLNEPLGDFEAVGFDMFALEDGWQWAWSCSHYPQELEDETRVERVRALMGEMYPNVSFFQADLTSFEAKRAAYHQVHGSRTFNVTHFSNVLEQLQPGEQDAMLAEATSLTEDFVMVNGFLQLNPNDQRQLLPRDNWFGDKEAYPYQSFVRDVKSGDERWHPIFKWKDARMSEVTMGTGRIAILGAGGAVLKRASLWESLNETGQEQEMNS